MGKTPITPEKVGLMESMLTERIKSEKETEENVQKRCNRLQALIGVAIGNIKRKPSAKTLVMDENSTSSAYSFGSIVTPEPNTNLQISEVANVSRIPMQHYPQQWDQYHYHSPLASFANQYNYPSFQTLPNFALQQAPITNATISQKFNEQDTIFYQNL